MKNSCALIFSTEVDKQKFLSFGYDRPRFMFMFGGRFTYLDFYLSMMYHAGCEKNILTASSHIDIIHDYMEASWGNSGWDILPFKNEMNKDFTEKALFAAFKQSLNNYVVLIKADHPCYFNTRNLFETFKKSKAKVFIPVIDNKPAPVVVVEKAYFMKKLSEKLNSKTSRDEILQNIFTDLQKDKKSVRKDYDGFLRNINTLDNYIKANFEVLKNQDKWSLLFKDMPLQSGVSERAQAVIDINGEMIFSMISDKCNVKGRVKGSMLFPGVQIGKGSEIIDSIILPGVVIGERVRIEKALIDISSGLPQNAKVNISDIVQIGRSKSVKNNDKYPDLLCNGYTFVSTNVFIPRGVSIGANCYISPNVGRNSFGRKKNISDGQIIAGLK